MQFVWRFGFEDLVAERAFKNNYRDSHNIPLHSSRLICGKNFARRVWLLRVVRRGGAQATARVL